jgi:hypothetical protein
MKTVWQYIITLRYRCQTSSQYCDKATGSMICGSDPGSSMFSAPVRSLPKNWGPTSLLSNGHWDSVPGVKHPGCEVNHWRPPSTVVKYEWSYSSTIPICLHSGDTDSFALRYTDDPHNQQSTGTRKKCHLKAIHFRQGIHQKTCNYGLMGPGFHIQYFLLINSNETLTKCIRSVTAAVCQLITLKGSFIALLTQLFEMSGDIFKGYIL